jgi:hypothetical protein
MMKVKLLQCLGYGLTEYLAENGWHFYQNQDGEYICEGSGDDPQSLIDAYNPWGYEKAKKLIEINEWFQAEVEKLTAGTTQAERDSWSVQISEAYGYRPISMLAAMAQARGIEVEALMMKVKAKAELFSVVYGRLQGAKDALEDKVKALPDAGELHRLPELWAVKCTG